MRESPSNARTMQFTFGYSELMTILVSDIPQHPTGLRPCCSSNIWLSKRCDRLVTSQPHARFYDLGIGARAAADWSISGFGLEGTKAVAAGPTNRGGQNSEIDPILASQRSTSSAQLSVSGAHWRLLIQEVAWDTLQYSDVKVHESAADPPPTPYRYY